MKVRNMKSARSNREVANQFVIEDDNRVMFQSYHSPIVEINRALHIITVYPHWDYSVTTGKYRNQFMDEEGFYEMANKAGFVQCMKDGKCGCFEVVIMK